MKTTSMCIKSAASFSSPVATALATLLVGVQALAVPVVDYRTYKDTTATTLAGQGTDDPVVGDIATASSAAAAFVIGYLPSPAVLGPGVGDNVSLTFSVSFNDSTAMANPGDNFRWAIFDLNGEAQDSATGGAGSGPNYAAAGTANTDNFRGYILGFKGGGGAGINGSIRERTAALASGQNAFAVTGSNAATATSLGTVGGDAVTLNGDVNGNGAGADFLGRLTLTRNSLGLVDVSGSFIGTNAAPGAVGNVFSQPDATANASSTYAAIGFLIAGPLNVEQALFQNIDVAVNIVPEASAAAALSLATCAGAAVVWVRRRRA